MNLENMETYINHIFDNNIHISNSIEKKKRIENNENKF